MQYTYPECMDLLLLSVTHDTVTDQRNNMTCYRCRAMVIWPVWPVIAVRQGAHFNHHHHYILAVPSFSIPTVYYFSRTKNYANP